MAAATFLTAIAAAVQDSEASRAQEQQLWRRLFEDPSQWWDYRGNKPDDSYPDFKHAKSGATLSTSSCPKWVKLSVNCLRVPNSRARAQYLDGERPIFESSSSSSSSFDNRSGGGRSGSGRIEIRSKNQQETVSSIVAALKSCSSAKDLKRGMEIHAAAAETGKNTNIFVASSLVSMYSKCGRMPEARKVFDGMPKRDAVSWNTMILGYAENGDGEMALELFEKMRVDDDLLPDSWTIVSALKGCSILAAAERPTEVGGEVVKILALERGMAIHREGLGVGCCSDRFVANALVDMYAKCGSLESARSAFEYTTAADAALWNVLILGYADAGLGELGLELFAELLQSEIEPNARTFVAALKNCTALAAREEARELDDGCRVRVRALEAAMALHSRALEKQVGSDIFVGNMLVDLYAKCGSMKLARRVFDGMRIRDVISWTSLVLGYCDNDDEQSALELVSVMLQDAGGKPRPNDRTFVAAIKACANLAEREVGQTLSGKLIKLESLEKGVALHAEAVKSGFASDVFVSNTLIDMYAKCGIVEAARSVFDGMKCRVPASFNAMMLGYIESGDAEEALEMFGKMSCEPDARSLVAALKACSILAGKEHGREIEGNIVKVATLEKARDLSDLAMKTGFFSDLFVANTLMDVFVKCGDLEQARTIFRSMQQRDVISWNVLMLGLAEGDLDKQALELFEEMKIEHRCRPDAWTYVAALKACAGVGALEMGRDLHRVIRELGLDDRDGVLATSIVDFYSRCGSMIEAREAFDSIKAPKDVVTWNSLLAGYARQGGRDDSTAMMLEAFNQMRDKGVKPVGITYLVLLTACSHAGLIDEAEQLIDEMRSKHSIKPEIEHYNCLIDALGRANRIEEALAMADKMPLDANCVTWTVILSACRKWKDSRAARIAFDELQRLECEESAAYVLMRDTV